MKAWLSQTGVPFVVRHVDDDLEAYEALVRRGFRRVPVTLIGERAVAGFDPEALAAAVIAARSDADGADHR